jgi:hypothetical protein
MRCGFPMSLTGENSISHVFRSGGFLKNEKPHPRGELETRFYKPACAPSYWNKLKGARQDIEYWIVGAPISLDISAGYPTTILATVVRQNTPLMNAPSPVCDKPFCVLYINQESLER